jgi:GT2 family glycosyltransferase
MREMCMSGSTSGMWKRSMAWIVRHRQTKELDTDRPNLNHRATSRLYKWLLRGTAFRPYVKSSIKSWALQAAEKLDWRIAFDVL